MGCELDCVLFVMGYFLGIPIGVPLIIAQVGYYIKHKERLF